MRIIFVLPSAGGGGGAHSIVQEAMGLTKVGVDVAIASPQHLAAQFRVKYPELEARKVRNPNYSSAGELTSVLGGHDLAIATTALSVEALIAANSAVEAGQRPRMGYYVQDYEPLFYPPGSPEWSQARRSYELMKDGLVFAKTDWLCEIVEANHNVVVRRVRASIDHDVYYPTHRSASEPLHITAMVRPQTPRRAPKRTLRILEKIAFDQGSRAEVTFFGCDPADLETIGISPSPAVTGLGVLNRAQVASTLRHSDLFLDLSDYQAFGRTGIEGMACGCVPVLPLFGGTGEYAEHGVNSFLVDTRSDDHILDAVDQFVGGRPERREEMRGKAIETALGYSISKAAYSEYELFREFV